MRVLMVSDVFFPRVNGVSTSIQTFRRDLAALGCETWLVTPEYPQGWSDDERVLRQPSRYLAFDPEDRMMKPRATLAACLELAGRVDVLHIQTPFVAHGSGSRPHASCACRRSRRITRSSRNTCITTCRCCRPRVARALARTISRRQCNAVDAVVAPSQQLADVLVGYGVTRPIHTIPTGSNLDEFAGGDGAHSARTTASRRIGP